MHEPLNWELLRYWKKTHPEELGCIRPVPIFVARRRGRILGFAALGGDPAYGTVPVIEPLFADNFWIGMRLIDAIEGYLTAAGHPYHLFWVDPEKNYSFLRIVEKAALGRRFAVDKDGMIWFKQTLPRRHSPRLRLIAA